MLLKWWTPSKSKDVQPFPWLSPDAIKYLESILAPDMDVIEFGGGGSTLWFSNRVASVTTYEPNTDWYMVLGGYDLPNVSLRSEQTWNGNDYGDLLFIDGEPVTFRGAWLDVAHHVSSTWIVLDNANRPEYVAERERMKEYAELIYTSNGNEGGTKYLVTEFWRVK